MVPITERARSFLLTAQVSHGHRGRMKRKTDEENFYKNNRASELVYLISLLNGYFKCVKKCFRGLC